MSNEDRRPNEAKLNIQQRIDASIEADKQPLEMMAPGFTLKLLDGQLLDRQQLEQNRECDQNEIISISDQTRVDIDHLALNGDEATVYTSQHFVRAVRGRDDKPHEVITNVKHREVWIKTGEGWLLKSIEELEQGPTFVDGELYD